MKINGEYNHVCRDGLVSASIVCLFDLSRWIAVTYFRRHVDLFLMFACAGEGEIALCEHS